MIQYLTKTTEEILVDTEVDVDSLQDFLKTDAEEQNYVLKSFSYEKKERKIQGEDPEEYYKCKIVKVFNSERYPDLPLRKILYTNFDPTSEYNNME